MGILLLILGGLTAVAFLGGLVGAWFARRRSRQDDHFARRLDEIDQHLGDVEATLTGVATALVEAEVRLERLEASVGGKAEAGAPMETPREPAAEILPASGPLAPAPEPTGPAPTEPVPPPSEDEAQPPAPLPREPDRPPAFWENAPAAAWQWLVGGQAVVRVGAVVLFFGVAFLLKYAYEHARIPIEVRLLAAALGAVALLGIGWRLRERRAMYALSLQGCGVGILYLTVFAAFRLYTLLPAVPALALLCGIAILSGILAVLQNSLAMAALGSSGGFLAPILTSTGGGNHVLLFSYYALLNAGIVGVAWFRRWSLLALLGFGFTFGIGTLWGVEYYRPRHFATTEPFLLLFFVQYAAIPILFLRRPEQGAERAIHATLLFGVPLVAFGLQAGLVADFAYGLAYSALGFGAFYLGLARQLVRRQDPRWRLLVEAFLALGVVFGTLAVPFGLGGRWTGAAWALEGAGLLWLGVRQERRLARAFALLLQLGAGLALLSATDRLVDGPPILNSAYLGCLFVSLAGLFSNWYLEHHKARLTTGERGVVALPFFWGLAWWAGGGLQEIDVRLSWQVAPQAALLFFAGSCALFGLAERSWAWPLARYPALALPPLMAVALAWSAATHDHPFARVGWLAWPLGFAAHLWLLWRREDQPSQCMQALHAAGVWLLAGVLSWELAWVARRLIGGGEAWPHAAWAAIPCLLLVFLDRSGPSTLWPVGPHRQTYVVSGGGPLAGFLLAWIAYTTIASTGDPRPLPYLPVVNPLDLAQLAALLISAWWLRGLTRSGAAFLTRDRRRGACGALGLAAFAILNGSALRTVHHWAGVGWSVHAMFRSMLVQAVLSLLWSLLALFAMASAARLALRPLWLGGAALMGVVVTKLFLIDLSNAGGVERIVSFIGVGVLMLLIGYLSPVPPKEPEKTP